MILTIGRECKQGFTIIELLVVISVILILFTIGAAGMGLAKKFAAKQKAKTEIYSLSTSIKAYELDYSDYPPDGITNLYLALTSNSKNGPYIEKSKWNIDGANRILDPWGKPYVYYNNVDGSTWAHARNVDSFDLYSYGPDGINNNGNGDDIGNW